MQVKEPRPPPPRLEPAMLERAAVVAEKGTLNLVPLNAWAVITIDGESRGRIRQMTTYQLTPGTHRIRAENDFSLPYEVDITVSPGEVEDLSIELKRMPVDVGLPSDLDAACRVSLEGRTLGTAGGLGYHFELAEPHPGAQYEVVLDCPEQAARQCTIKDLKFGETVWLVCP